MQGTITIMGALLFFLLPIWIYIGLTTLVAILTWLVVTFIFRVK
jgi:hypothetical protein